MKQMIAALFITLAVTLAASAARARAIDVAAAPDSLDAVLDAAAPGSVIMLAPGTYARLAGRGIGGSPGNPITLRPADPADPPRFAAMDLRDAHDLVIEGLVFDYRFVAGDATNIRPFQIFDSSQITLRRVLFDGDVAIKGKAHDIGFPTAVGLSLRGVDGMTIEDSEFRRFLRGLVVATSQNITIRHTHVHAMRSDGINFVQVVGVRIEENTIGDFSRSLDSPDHADLIQFWTNGSNAPSTDILIRNNLLISGRGAWSQSIFMRNDMVDRGRAGAEMFYRNIHIEGNLIINAHLGGIAVGATENLVIRNNTVVRNPASEGAIENVGLWTPRISASKISHDVSIIGNVTSSIAGYEGQKDWTVSENLFVQDRTRLEPNHYSLIFIGGDPALPASFLPRPGGPLDGVKIGTPLLR